MEANGGWSSMLTSVMCLLIIAIGFAVTSWPTPAPKSQQTSTESSADQEVIQLDNTEPASPPIWNDGIAEEIGDLSIDTRLLERKSERDWDETAPTLLHRLNLNHQQPTELEPIQ